MQLVLVTPACVPFLKEVVQRYKIPSEQIKRLDLTSIVEILPELPKMKWKMKIEF